MKLEDAIPFLRGGRKIQRTGRLEKDDCLHVNREDENRVYCSYYMTIFDILAQDWEVIED